MKHEAAAEGGMMHALPTLKSSPFRVIWSGLHDAVLSKRMLNCVRTLQTACGVSAQGVPTNLVVHFVFSLASAFGDEAFYSLALPLCAWVLDLRLSRRLAVFWASTYYVGQAVKDLFKLPRPPAPVVRLERRYSAEYGLPSTHTMGSLIPLFLAACHWSDGSGVAIPAGVLSTSALWSGLIAVSRLYQGVHSIPDVAAGYVLGAGLLAFWLPFGGRIDAFIAGNQWAWLVIALGAAGCIVGYPAPERWTNSYGDTALIVATAAGFLEGCCLAPYWRNGVSLQVLYIGAKLRTWLLTKVPCGKECVPEYRSRYLQHLQPRGAGSVADPREGELLPRRMSNDSVVCHTFHTFCRLFAEELYEEHIHLPVRREHERVMEHYHRVGFTGAIGSTDLTHIRWDTCPFSMQRSYTGKEGYPTLAYQATVDHTGRVLGVTRGFAGAQNDNTIARFDHTIEQVRDNPLYRDKEVSLRRKDGSLVTVKGNYLIVDNGYHKRSVLIKPTKMPLTAEETCFSKWLESVRRDVECFFGRLKGRLRLLKLPVMLRKPEEVDNVFYTRCILHNMLHAIDGLHELEADVHWAGQDGLHSAWVADPLEDVTSIGLRKWGDKDEPTEVEASHDGVRKMPLDSFTYRRTCNDISWLRYKATS